MPRSRKDSEITMSQKRIFRSNSMIVTHRHLLLLLPLALIFGMACDSSNPPPDSDQDGVSDELDAFPYDSTETADNDDDGVGNNADLFPDDPTETADGDGDGVGDNGDAFPDDPTETADDDGDSVGNNADAFPSDPTETADGDGDGLGDNGDAFPDDPTETADDDGDSVGNNADNCPNEANDTQADDDGDGTGDPCDAFPQDDTEWADTDADGVGDRLDAYPEDSEEATYGSEGPYVVGVRTLSMGDRDLEVFYPAQAGSQEGMETAYYELLDPFPAELLAIIPPEVNARVEVPAYRDLPSSDDGAFPVIIFSHGSGGFRLAYSKLLAGIASHGFVVASIDHNEWGLLARLGFGPPPEAARDAGQLVLDALSLLDAESEDPESVLAGAADTSRVATAGHSAGGIAAFAFATEADGFPEIMTNIGYATVPFSVMPDKPVLLLLGAEDFAITTEATLSSYDALIETKRYVAVTDAAHNSFTDQCEIIYDGNDIIAAAQEIFGALFPESLAALARDGCLPENLAPSEFWRITQHYTVAHLRRVFSLNEEPRGLTAGSAELFGDIVIDYRFEED